jgi:hypothetical protein
MLRIHVRRFDGNADIAGAALTIGRMWCRHIYAMQQRNIPVPLWRNEVVSFGAASAQLRVEVAKSLIPGEWIAQVWVNASGGCAELAPFLLKKAGAAHLAYYSDGKTEVIGSGVRSKQVKLPAEVQSGTKTGAMFSGLMRMAVQCSHARGVNTVFSYNWAKTHGIVEYLDQAPANEGSSAAIAAQSARNRYWVVEISADGVFAAPVSWTGKCCDGFLVRKYLATGSTDLSLQWAYNAGRAGVTRLLTSGAVASAYAATPFHTEHGWAFSRSGLHAQSVTAASTGLHYDTKRWKIDFTITMVNNAPTLSAAAISMVESGQVVFPATDPMWIPTGVVGEWSAIPRILVSDLTGSYAGPIHVFYQGESEFVTRYENSGVTAFPAVTTTDATALIYFGAVGPIRQKGSYAAPTRCGVPMDPTHPPFLASEPAFRLVEGAFTGVKSGFTSNHTSVGATASTTKDYETQTSRFNGVTSTSNIIPAEVFAFSCCSAAMHSEMYRNLENLDVDYVYRSGPQSSYSAALLLDGEREGILLLSKLAQSGASQTTWTWHDIGYLMRNWNFKAYGTPPPGACWTDFSGEGTPPGFGAPIDNYTGGVQDPPAYSAYNDESGTFNLIVGSQRFTGALPKTGDFIRADINKAFSNPIPPVNLNLNLLAFHGAMVYAPADPAATQPTNFPPLKDQRNNAVWLFPDNLSTLGGFASDGTRPVAFVGQA